MRLSRVIYRDSLGTRIVADATERSLDLKDGIVWVGGNDGGATGIAVGRCLALTLAKPGRLPTKAKPDDRKPRRTSVRLLGWRR